MGAAFLAIACSRPVSQPSAARSGGPKVKARVLTIRMTTEPEKQDLTYEIMAWNGKVRLGNEKDRWRLIDLQDQSVLFVDDVAQIWWRESLDVLKREKKRQWDRPLPAGIPRARIAATAQKRRIGGVDATQYVIRAGGYVRSLWLSDDPLLGSGFFPLLIASDPVSPSYAGVMRDAGSGLIGLHGFPVLDETELPWKGQVLKIRNELTSVTEKDVPEELFTIPANYREHGTVTGSAAGRPPGESLPAGRNAPATGSRSSAKDRRNP